MTNGSGISRARLLARRLDASVSPSTAWPLLPTVEHPQQFDHLWPNSVRYQVGRARDDEFTGSCQPSNPPHLRMPQQTPHRVEDAVRHDPGSLWVVLCDVASEMHQIPNRRFGPNKLHSGGSSSSSVPQLDNHFATLS